MAVSHKIQRNFTIDEIDTLATGHKLSELTNVLRERLATNLYTDYETIIRQSLYYIGTTLLPDYNPMIASAYDDPLSYVGIVEIIAKLLKKKELSSIDTLIDRLIRVNKLTQLETRLQEVEHIKEACEKTMNDILLNDVCQSIIKSGFTIVVQFDKELVAKLKILHNKIMECTSIIEQVTVEISCQYDDFYSSQHK